MYAEREIVIIVPFLIESDILKSIIAIPDNISIKLFTRNRDGYLPSIKKAAQPALNKLIKKSNLKIYIDNRIHAKIWIIDDKFVIVHSMNGTPTSEYLNFEAGIISIQKTLISEASEYSKRIEKEAIQIKY